MGELTSAPRLCCLHRLQVRPVRVLVARSATTSSSAARCAASALVAASRTQHSHVQPVLHACSLKEARKLTWVSSPALLVCAVCIVCRCAL